MLTADFDYHLPPELIAQFPAPQRDQSRLLVLDRGSGKTTHRQFRDVAEYLRPGDVLILNNSKVLPARLRGNKSGSGGQIEVLLVEENATNDWWVMLRPGKRVRAGTRIEFHDRSGGAAEVSATVKDKNDEGHCRLEFEGTANIVNELPRLGEVPLPPYIARAANATSDVERYQTVYAQPAGSVAAPTAGLHFTDALLEDLRARGVQIGFVTLHVGLGTFAPVKAENLEEHVMHEERYVIGDKTAQLVHDAKREGRRVIAVGTTSVRVLESSAAANKWRVSASAGKTRIFIHPPYDFQIVDALLTNFHLPQSTLLMLVSAFASPGKLEGREMVLRAYAGAIEQRYRFYSYGDAMLIL
ncbi:MAG: tRNA preQ1(34) S-adenosylmethionine ribosyltransferase-isomerase QueA [Verrucomicrobiota bacterium]